VTDYFALLKEPRRPWIDSDLLKEKFIALSAETHPDRVHTANHSEKQAAQNSYTQLNSAYTCLREPKDRLSHLLELELGRKPEQVQTVPAELMNFFLEISGASRESDAFLAEQASVVSPMLKVQMFERGQELSEKLRAEQNRIAEWHQQLSEELKTLDARWETSVGASTERMDILGQLSQLGRLFGYCARWNSQLQERILQLSL
jgi:DnaJ-domain-containing protein 1